MLRLFERRRLSSRRGLQPARLRLDMRRQLAVPQRATVRLQLQLSGQLRRRPVPGRPDLRNSVGRQHGHARSLLPVPGAPGLPERRRMQLGDPHLRKLHRSFLDRRPLRVPTRRHLFLLLAAGPSRCGLFAELRSRAVPGSHQDLRRVSGSDPLPPVLLRLSAGLGLRRCRAGRLVRLVHRPHLRVPARGVTLSQRARPTAPRSLRRSRCLAGCQELPLRPQGQWRHA